MNTCARYALPHVMTAVQVLAFRSVRYPHWLSSSEQQHQAFVQAFGNARVVINLECSPLRRSFCVFGPSSPAHAGEARRRRTLARWSAGKVLLGTRTTEKVASVTRRSSRVSASLNTSCWDAQCRHARSGLKKGITRAWARSLSIA